MKYIFIGLCLMICFAQCPEAMAQETLDRKGFFLGLIPGPGKLFSTDIDALSKYSVGIYSNFRVGAGLTDTVLIFEETGGLSIPQDAEGKSLIVTHFIIGGQYFVTEHIYGKLGFGLGMISTDSTTNTRYDQGLVIGGGVGYESRLSKRFAISGGGDVLYHDTDLLAGTILSLNLGFTWYW